LVAVSVVLAVLMRAGFRIPIGECGG
jgi:hypothetical protein